MNISGWASDAWSIVQNVSARIWNFIVAHPAHIAVAIFFVVILSSAFEYFAASASKKIIVYVGAPGASSNWVGQRVAKAIRDTSSTPGFKYQALVVPTSGGLEIDDKVAADDDGRSIGISVDRINHVPGLQALLPLDWGYVHILARLEFLKSIHNTKELPKEFSDVVRKLKYGRVYADSESLQLAQRLFALYNTPDINDVLAPALDNWDEASAAIKADQIDLAFYCGPIGATTVQTLAETGKVVLLGLDTLAPTLSQNPDLTMITTTIPRNSYWASPLGTEPPHYFCSRDLPTLASRRMIVTSRAMDKRDAYLIAGALTATLSDTNDIPANTWQRDNPQSKNSGSDVVFGLTPHIGAQMQHRNEVLPDIWKPWTWNAFYRSIGIGLLSVLATSALANLRTWLQPAPVAPTVAATAILETSAEFKLIKKQIDDFQLELEALPFGLPEEQHNQLNKRIREILSTIRERLERHRLTVQEGHLLTEMARTLRLELASIAVSPNQFAKSSKKPK